MEDLRKYQDVTGKNIQMFRDQARGEEGVEYMQSVGDLADPLLPNIKALEKEIRREIN